MRSVGRLGRWDDLGPTFESYISTFENPEVLIPTTHAFDPGRISRFNIADMLPRYEGFAHDRPPSESR